MGFALPQSSVMCSADPASKVKEYALFHIVSAFELEVSMSTLYMVAISNNWYDTSLPQSITLNLD